MSFKFLQPLDISSDLLHRSPLTVVHQQGQVNGEFVIHFLTAEIFRTITNRAEPKILLILNHHSPSHWSSIGYKLGWNLNSFKDGGRLQILDLLQETYKSLTAESEMDSSLIDPLTGTVLPDRVLARCRDAVQQLYPQPNPENPKMFVILEDFTGLIHTSQETDKGGLEFLRNLQQLRDDLDISLVTVVTSSDLCPSTKYYANLVAHSMSTLTFTVTQLKTGVSSEVHGVLRVSEHEKVVRPELTSPRPPRTYHYKLADRSIHFTPF